jgi:hypothetical protein
VKIEENGSMGGEMKRRLRFAFAIGLVVAIMAVAVSAVAFRGHDASATRPSGSPKARTPAALAEQIRVDRRDSLRRTGCSKRARRLEAPDV